jgi:hypothetical protein
MAVPPLMSIARKRGSPLRSTLFPTCHTTTDRRIDVRNKIDSALVHFAPKTNWKRNNRVGRAQRTPRSRAGHMPAHPNTSTHARVSAKLRALNTACGGSGVPEADWTHSLAQLFCAASDRDEMTALRRAGRAPRIGRVGNCRVACGVVEPSQTSKRSIGSDPFVCSKAHYPMQESGAGFFQDSPLLQFWT